MANLVGALLVPLLPLSTALLTTQPIIHPTKSMKGATGVIERSILDEPELKPGQGVSQAHLNYIQMCDSVYDNMYDDEEDQLSTPVLMLDHRIVKKSNGIRVPLAKVNWLCEDMPTWIRLDALRLQAPFLVIEYASRRKEVREAPNFSWTKEKLESQETVANMARAFSAMIRSSPKFKFGVEVPRNIKHAIELDRQNGDIRWQEAIELELKQINEYRTFRSLLPMDSLEDYQQIPYHFVFDVKFDGRCKARLVANGSKTEQPKDDIFSGVVGLESVRLTFLITQMNGLQVCATDIGNAFLYGQTREKVYIKAGREFGAAIAGQPLIIDKGLYGLRSSSARFHEHLSRKLLSMDYKPSKADPDLWIKDCGTHYEYIARYIDDVLAFGKDPMSTILELRKDYILKGIGQPEYYLGGDVIELNPTWHSLGIQYSLSAKTYCTNVITKYEELLGGALREHKSLMEETYHPKLDTSPFLDERAASLYRGLVGSANWMVTLGQCDIAYSTNTMAHFGMKPRDGHLKAMKRIYGYIKMHPQGHIPLDTSFHDWSPYNIKEYDWNEFYPDAIEEEPPDMPDPRGAEARITVYKDADHAHDQVTHRSITGVLLFVNNTVMTWISKRQKTIKTSTYGSELVAARVAVELIMEYRYKLRMLGMPINGPALLLGDNNSVVLNTTVPSSPLKKKHNAIAWHRIREAIACKILVFAKIDSKDNYADMLTKPLPPVLFHRLVEPLLFRRAPTVPPPLEPKRDEPMEPNTSS